MQPARRFQFVSALVALFSVAASACSSAAPATPAQPTSAPTAAAASGAAGASSGNWDKIVAAAKQEGTLVLSTHAGVGYEEYAQIVKKALPDLKVEVTNIKASDFTARAITEQQNGQYLWDVHMGPSSNVFSVLTPAGALQNIKPFLADLPADVKDNSKWAGGFEMYTDPQNPVTLVTMLQQSPGIFVNRELVPEGLSKPEDLLDPKWKGKIAVYNPVVSNGGSMSLMGLLADKGDDYLRNLLKGQEVKYIATSRQITDFVAQGRYPIVIGAEDPYLQELKSKGVGTKVERVTDFGTFALASGVSVLKNAPHPNATKVYLAWALSKEGQDAYAKVSSTDANTRRLDVPVYHPDSTPDWAHLDRLKIVLGTASGVGPSDRTLEIAKEYQ